ncbi:MAG: hypothetical protein M1504_01015 [Candidatus Marsarchaeota archaeon]|nr:hypothetical protein [Candidatus Marsarchaeota archaeon]
MYNTRFVLLLSVLFVFMFIKIGAATGPSITFAPTAILPSSASAPAISSITPSSTQAGHGIFSYSVTAASGDNVRIFYWVTSSQPSSGTAPPSGTWYCTDSGCDGGTYPIPSSGTATLTDCLPFSAFPGGSVYVGIEDLNTGQYGNWELVTLETGNSGTWQNYCPFIAGIGIPGGVANPPTVSLPSPPPSSITVDINGEPGDSVAVFECQSNPGDGSAAGSACASVDTGSLGSASQGGGAEINIPVPSCSTFYVGVEDTYINTWTNWVQVNNPGASGTCNIGGASGGGPGCFGTVCTGNQQTSSIDMTASAGCGSSDNCNINMDVVAFEYCGNSGTGGCTDPGFSCTSTGGSAPPITCTYTIPQCNGGGFIGGPQDGSGTGSFDPGSITNAPCMVDDNSQYPCGGNAYCDAPNYDQSNPPPASTAMATATFGSSDSGTYGFCEYDYSYSELKTIDNGCITLQVSGGALQGPPGGGPSCPPGSTCTPSQQVTAAICGVYFDVNTIVFILALTLMILGGAIYGGAHILPGQTRGQVQAYAMGLILGGVAGAVIALLAPWILGMIYAQSASIIAATC